MLHPSFTKKKMEVLKLIYVWILYVSISIRSEKIMATLKPGQFPDSNSDTGAMSAAFSPEKSPNGETFFKRPSGRPSDGRLIVDFIAEQLNIPYLSAYLDSIGTNFKHGANFATSGATILRHNESWFERGLSPFPLDIQVEHYTQFKDRSAFFYKQGNDTFRLPVPDEFGKALHIIDIGQNDIAYGFAAKETNQQIISSFTNTINQLGSAVQQLYGLGARIFWIHNTGPIGCLPLSTTTLQIPKLGVLDEHGCIKNQNDIAIEFNKQLKDKVVELRAQLVQATITYVDIYTAKYSLISNALSLGFEDASAICCGRFVSGVRVECGTKANVNGTEIIADPCENPLKVISWDGVHYSEGANSYVANQILNNASLSDPPI